MKGSTNGQDPAVSWFFNDWHGGTMTFSRHQKGCYMDLLTAQFNNGHLSEAEIKNVLGSDFGSQWPTLQKKFATDDNGLFYNKRLESELLKRKGFNNSRRENLGHMGNGNGIGYEKEIENILELLNSIVGADFKKTAKKNILVITARLKEGYSYEDFEAVIKHKWQTWGTDTKMKEFLRPETLFGSKFDGYLQAAKIRPLSKVDGILRTDQQQEAEIEAKYRKNESANGY